MKNARKMYMDYIKEMNSNETTRELIAYQDYGECFAIMSLKTRYERGEWIDFFVMRIDINGNIEPIRTFSSLGQAVTAFSALSYDSRPIITLPF